jgi:hypothetical protein
VQADVGLFYESLAPYGFVFVPDVADPAWRPYTVGHWVFTDEVGWTWISDEDFGWAAYHYGRWAYTPEYGWVWIPGVVWAPAWVVFRSSGDWIGWAPLPPESGWTLEAGLDVGRLNVDVTLGSWAWSFVPAWAFVEPDVRTRIVYTAYNPALLRTTTFSTRFAVADGRVVLRGVEPALIERLRGRPLPRFRIRDAGDRPGRARVEGDAVVTYRPRLAPKAPPRPPAVVRPRATDDRTARDAWLEQRRAALRAHLDAQRKALEQDDTPSPGAPTAAPGAGAPPANGAPPPRPGASAEDVARRREAARKALEDERKRLEELLERQRRRRESGDDGHDDHGRGDDKGRRDKDKDKDK